MSASPLCCPSWHACVFCACALAFFCGGFSRPAAAQARPNTLLPASSPPRTCKTLLKGFAERSTGGSMQMGRLPRIADENHFKRPRLSLGASHCRSKPFEEAISKSSGHTLSMTTHLKRSGLSLVGCSGADQGVVHQGGERALDRAAAAAVVHAPGGCGHGPGGGNAAGGGAALPGRDAAL